MKFSKKVKWYAKMLFLFSKMSLISQLEYRTNFIAFIAVELGYMIIKLLYLVVIITQNVSIGPLTPNMVTIFVGTYIFMTGIWMLLSGVNDVPIKVLSGEMDMLMTKPGSLQFLQTFGKFNFGLTVPNVAVGIVLICTGWIKSGIPITFPLVAGFVFYIVMGSVLTYSFILIPSLLVFWTSSVNGVGNLIIATWEFNNLPMLLYNKSIQLIGTFVIPVFLLTNWAGMFVLGLNSVFYNIWGILVPVSLLLISRIMWKKAFMKYQSAGG